MAELRNSFISWRISWVFVHVIFPLEPPGHWTLEINQKTKLSIWACKVLILLWYMTRDPENFITTSRHHIYDLGIERGGRYREVLEKFFLWPQRPPWDWHFLNVKGLFRMYTRNSGYTKVSFHPYNFFIEADNIFSRIL